MKEKLTLLVISPTFPYPLVAGGKLRIYHLLKELSKKFNITLLTLIEDDENNNENNYKNISALDFIHRVIPVPISQNKQSQALRLIRYSLQWLLGTPAEVLVKKSPALESQLKNLLVSESFDYIQIEYIQNAQYFTAISKINASKKTRKKLNKKTPTYLVAHDISYISQERKSEVATGLSKWFWSREARLMKNYELTYWPKFDTVFTMSETDKTHLLLHQPSTNVRIIPNGVDTTELHPIKEGETPTITFVGWMRHLPNRDAIEWFIKEIWPNVKQQHKTVKLRIVGKGLPSTLAEISNTDPRIDYLGYVEDIAQCVGESWLSIVPIRIGSGSRLKILESMALGTPVVTTTVGCEGIDATHAIDAEFADTPKEFANAVVSMLNNQEKRHAIAQNARTLVETKYSWKTIAETATKAILSTNHDNI